MPLPDQPPACTECGEATRRVPSTRHYRRGARVIAVETALWECAACADPFTGRQPFRFADGALLRWTDARAAGLWRERFGEDLPPSRRGQHKGPHRVLRVPVLLTPEEVERLDALRGDLTRSEYLRRSLKAAG